MIILLQGSEYLRQLVSGCWSESQRSRIVIKYECSPDNLESILRYAFGHRRTALAYDKLHIDVENGDDGSSNNMIAGAVPDAGTDEDEGKLHGKDSDAVEQELDTANVGDVEVQRLDWGLVALQEEKPRRLPRTIEEHMTSTAHRIPDCQPAPQIIDIEEDEVWVEEIITRKNAMSLYGDAQFFMLPNLAAECEQFIARHIVGFHNVIRFWLTSIQMGLESLERHCRAIFYDHFDKVIPLSYFEVIGLTFLARLQSKMSSFSCLKSFCFRPCNLLISELNPKIAYGMPFCDGDYSNTIRTNMLTRYLSSHPIHLQR